MIPPQTTLAFTLANGYAVQLITLSVALIGLTVTFAKDFQRNTTVSRVFLVCIWLIFLASIVAGIANIKALISIVAPLKPTDSPLTFSDGALRSATIQEGLFFIGLILFIIQGALSIFLKKSPTSPPASKF